MFRTSVSKKGTNLETNLLKVSHVSKPKFNYLELPNSISKLAYLNVNGLPSSPCIDLYSAFRLVIMMLVLISCYQTMISVNV